MLKTVRVPEKFAPLFEEAQRYVQQYFADVRRTPERGTVEVAGQRYVLVRAASMSVEFYEMVKSFYGEEEEAVAVTHALLFDVAHAMGLADAKAFAERMNVTDPIARLSAGPIHFAHAGWAFVDISPESEPTADNNYYLLYDHPYSFESDAWQSAGKPAQQPVCVMGAGYSSGWCEHSFGLPLVATEILCRAKGDEACRFIMAPPDQIQNRIARYVELHPTLAPRIMKYSVPGFFSARTDRQLLRTNLDLEQRAQQKARELAAINLELQRDIAQRKQTEIALSASMELTERLIEALPGGVVHVAASGQLLRANAEAQRFLGLSWNEVTQRYITDYDADTVFEDGSSARVDDYPVARAMATGLPQPATTIGICRPNGEVSWAIYRAVPTRDPESQAVTGAVVTFIDITERKRFEEKLRHTQKLESLGVLAGGIAHDFNNLLMSILGNASIARTMGECDPRITTMLEDIELGAKRAADLTKQMLDYAGQGRFELRPVDLPALVREMTTLLHAMIPKHVEVHHHVQDGVPTISADATQLRQVIMNLITNAAEAMCEQPGRVVISVDERHLSAADLEKYVANSAVAGRFVCLQVRDAGIGMSAETAARIFDPFFTTKFQGRGLGMAAVLGIVSGHGGVIQVETREREGTVVSVAFPVKRVQAPHDIAAAVADRVALVVDDDDSVRRVTERMLEASGFRVLSASNGIEALRMAALHIDAIDLIMMDVTMPQLSGIEALKRLRASGNDVPVILSSGYVLNVAASVDAGATAVLLKPYNVTQLSAAIARARSSPA